MKRVRPFECPIAGKSVDISLRHGGGLGEPHAAYVRCEERDCQYVDLNEPPCPLQAAMFADGSESRVAEYMTAHAGIRVCYACLVEALGVSHEQIRRASWQMRDLHGYVIRPSRCEICRRRGVTIGTRPSARLVERRPERAAADGSNIVATSVARPSDRDSGTVIERLASYLRAHPGYAFCVYCLGTQIGRPSRELRDPIWELEATGSFSVRTAPCMRCLSSKHVIRYEEPSGDEALAGRVVEFLVRSAGEGRCASCVAFATDLSLATVRRVLAYLEPRGEVSRWDASCSGCGRRLGLVGLTDGDRARLQRISGGPSRCAAVARAARRGR